jgi:hypothetical protein
MDAACGYAADERPMACWNGCCAAEDCSMEPSWWPKGDVTLLCVFVCVCEFCVCVCVSLCVCVMYRVLVGGRRAM